jgi:Sec-independent protein translocase protein TatA
MEIFNVGPLELVFIVLLALIILGPDRMVKTARQVGKWINHIVKSPLWTSILQTSHEIQDLPRKLVEETGIEENWKEIEQSTKQISKDLNVMRGEIESQSHIHLQTDPVKTMFEQDNAQVKSTVSETLNETYLDGKATEESDRDLRVEEKRIGPGKDNKSENQISGGVIGEKK